MEFNRYAQQQMISVTLALVRVLFVCLFVVVFFSLFAFFFFAFGVFAPMFSMILHLYEMNIDHNSVICMNYHLNKHLTLLHM